MPQDITDVAEFTSPIVAPADGDPANAASVLAGLQGLANRTRFQQSMILGFGTIATLRAAGAPSNTGSIAAVTGYGLFVWAPVSLATDDGLFVVNPVGASVGRWVSMTGQLNVDGGIAQLDSSGRIAATTIHGGIVQTARVVNAGSGTQATTTSFSDMTGFAVTLSAALAGDLVLIAYNASIVSGATLSQGTFSLSVSEDGGGYTAEPGSQTATRTAVATSDVVTGGTTVIHPVAASGALAIKGQSVWGNTSGSVGTSNSLVAVLIRP